MKKLWDPLTFPGKNGKWDPSENEENALTQMQSSHFQTQRELENGVFFAVLLRGGRARNPHVGFGCLVFLTKMKAGEEQNRREVTVLFSSPMKKKERENKNGRKKK